MCKCTSEPETSRHFIEYVYASSLRFLFLFLFLFYFYFYFYFYLFSSLFFPFHFGPFIPIFQFFILHIFWEFIGSLHVFKNLIDSFLNFNLIQCQGKIIKNKPWFINFLQYFHYFIFPFKVLKIFNFLIWFFFDKKRSFRQQKPNWSFEMLVKASGTE